MAERFTKRKELEREQAKQRVLERTRRVEADTKAVDIVKVRQEQDAQVPQSKQFREVFKPVYEEPFNLKNDIKAIAAQNPEDVKNWDKVASLAVELNSAYDENGNADPEARQFAQYLLNTYRDQLTPFLESQGVNPDDIIETAPDPSLWQKAVGTFVGALDFIDRPLQGVTAFIDASTGDDALLLSDADKLKALGRGLIFQKQDQKLLDVLQRNERNPDNRISALEAFDVSGSGGVSSSILNFAGELVLDPTNYVTLGTSGLGKKVLKGLTELGGSHAAIAFALKEAGGLDRAIAKGLISDAEQEMLQDFLEREARKGVETLLGKLGDDLSRETIQANLKKIDRKIAKRVSKTTRALRQVGPSVKFAGREIPGTGYVLRKVRSGFQKAGILSTPLFTRVADDVAATTLDDLISTGNIPEDFLAETFTEGAGAPLPVKWTKADAEIAILSKAANDPAYRQFIEETFGDTISNLARNVNVDPSDIFERLNGTIPPPRAAGDPLFSISGDGTASFFRRPTPAGELPRIAENAPRAALTSGTPPTAAGIPDAMARGIMTADEAERQLYNLVGDIDDAIGLAERRGVISPTEADTLGEITSRIDNIAGYGVAPEDYRAGIEAFDVVTGMSVDDFARSVKELAEGGIPSPAAVIRALPASRRTSRAEAEKFLQRMKPYRRKKIKNLPKSGELGSVTNPIVTPRNLPVPFLSPKDLEDTIIALRNGNPVPPNALVNLVSMENVKRLLEGLPPDELETLARQAPDGGLGIKAAIKSGDPSRIADELTRIGYSDPEGFLKHLGFNTAPEEPLKAITSGTPAPGALEPVRDEVSNFFRRGSEQRALLAAVGENGSAFRRGPAPKALLPGPPSARSSFPSAFEEAVKTSARPVAEDTVKVAKKLLQSDLRVTIQKGAIRKLVDDSPIISTLRKAVIPRATIASRFGTGAANVVGRAKAEQIAQFDNAVYDMAVRIKGISTQARKLFSNEEDFNRFLSKALSSKEDFEFLRAEALRTGSTETRKLLDTLHAIRTETRDALVRAGVPEDILRDAFDYIPRALSKEGKAQLEKAFREGSESVRAALIRSGLINEATGRGVEASIGEQALKARKFVDPDIQDIFHVNREASALLAEMGVEGVESLFDTNVIAGFTKRAQTAFEHMTRAKMIDGLADELVDLQGRKLVLASVDPVVNSSNVREAALRGFVDVFPNDKETLLKVFAPPEIADEIRKVDAIIRNDVALKKVAENINKWNSLWATYATVPLVFFGFHARNAASNIFNAGLGGLTNPERYVRAFKYQKANRSIKKIMKAEGILWEEAASKFVGKGGDTAAVRVLREARDTGVLQGGFFADLAHDNLFESKLGKWADNNWVANSGRQFGGAIEDNARLGLFIDQLSKGSSPRQAADHVRKYLFDYRDLTAFESKGLRTFSRFYTFMRKNVALQASVLATAPNRIFIAQDIAEEFANVLAGDPENDGKIIPEWAKLAGLKERGGNLVGIETPFDAFTEFNATVLGGVSLLSDVPFLNDILPEQSLPRNTQDRVSAVLGLFAGGPTTAVTNLYESATGVDTFTGGPVRNEGLIRWTDTVLPVIGKFYREKGRFDKVVQGEDDPELRFMNWFLGLQVYQLDEEQQSRAIRGLLGEGSEVMSQLFRRGGDRMTMSELREAGLIDRQNRVYRALMFGEDVAELIPKRVRDALDISLETPATPGTSTVSDKVWNAQQVLEAVEAEYGRKLTDEERTRVLLTLPGVPSTKELADEFGIEGIRKNIFDSPESRSGLSEEDIQIFTGIAEAYGFTAEQLRDFRPRLTKAERIFRDGREKGLTDVEIASRLREDLSRKETGLIFGTDELERFRDGTPTQEDLDKLARRSKEEESYFILISRLLTGQAPSPEALQTYLYQDLLTKSDQKRLGLPVGPTIPSRKDVRSEADKFRDAVRKQNAIDSRVSDQPVEAPQSQASRFREIVGGA